MRKTLVVSGIDEYNTCHTIRHRHRHCTPRQQQVLTWTSGGERLASGALDGSVVVWSISAEGILVPVVTYGGLCHPYRLVAIGR